MQKHIISETIHNLIVQTTPKIAPSPGDPGPRLTRGTLDPPESSPQTARRSGRPTPFFCSSPESLPILYNGAGHGSGSYPNKWFLGLTRVHNPNGISIGSAAFAGLTVVTNRQTNRQTDTQTDHATLIARGRIFALCACDAA